MSANDLLKVFEKSGCLPHQASFAAGFFASGTPKTHILICPPGSGKGFAAAAICTHAWSTGQAKRILILTPPALVDQWHYMIQRGHSEIPVVVIDRRRLRELEAGVEAGELPWPRSSVVIMSLDFAKQQDVAKSLTMARWDLLVIDEAHHLTRQSQRRELALNLVDGCLDARVLLLRTVGPVSEDDLNPKHDRLMVNANVTVWSRESVRDREGNPLLPDVQIQWVTHQRRFDEVALLSRLQNSIQSLQLTRPSDRMVATILLQSASSSLFALEQRLNRIRQHRNDIIHGRGQDAMADPDADDAISLEPSDVTSDDAAGPQPELTELANQLLQEIENVESDSKLEALLQFLDSIGVQANQDRRACIFTRFVDTSIYLESALVEHYPRVATLTGSQSFEERDRILQQFTSDGGIIIATEAVSTAIPEVAAVIFYDLPWNPAVLDARISQFVRVGKSGPVRVFAFTDDSHALVIERLQKTVADIKRAVGEGELQKILFSEVADNANNTHEDCQ
jgi:superfamily II DNA or RNA helicase